jgi:hypothetical protein
MKNLMLLLSKGRAISNFLKDKLSIFTSVFVSIFLLNFFSVNTMRERKNEKCSNCSIVCNGYSVSGNIDNALITLNGADNVTLSL